MAQDSRTLERSQPSAVHAAKRAPSPHPLLPPEVQDDYRRRGLWEDRTLAEIVAGWAADDPARIAVTGEMPLTYAELWERARRLGGTLAEGGVGPGEFVLAVMSNSWQGVVLAVAASVAGVALSPLSSRASTTLVVNIAEQVGARGLVLEADLLADETWQTAFASLRAGLRGGPVLLQGSPPRGSEYASLRTLEQSALSGPLMEQRDPDPGRVSLAISTGGTTGRPKSVLHCENSMIYASRRFAAATDFTQSDVLVAFGPYGHASGSVLEVVMPLLCGASILPNRRWKALPVAEAIARYGGTFCITVGTHMFDLLALEPESDGMLRSLRLVTSGAGPDQLFVDAERRFGFPIVRVFGLSECVGHAVGRPSDPAELRLHRDGVPFEGVDWMVRDAAGAPAPLGAAGEYLCRSPSLFMGYFGQPELTQSSVTEDGYYRTGDLMTADADGYITWSGRIKDVIRRGGLQIDALEMEQMLSEHAAVAEVVVIGEPDERLGERVVVVVVPRAGAAPLDLDGACAHLTSRGLGRESLPEKLVIAGSLPRTEFGKFHRVEIKRRLVDGAAFDG